MKTGILAVKTDMKKVRSDVEGMAASMAASMADLARNILRG